jgi:4-amino-4-deoxy-L-arabinose transferase-like glycosyltransferase
MIAQLTRHKLILVLALAIIIRLAILLAFPNIFAFDQTGQVHGSDAYDAYAQNLLATGIYGRQPGQPDAAIPPLYSYALALVYTLFGRGYLQVGLFHILLDCISIACLYHIGKRLFGQGEWVGALAGVFYALYPYLIFQNLTLIDTPLFMTLLYAFLLVIVLLRERDSLDRATLGLAALGGLLLGLSMLVRPIMPPLAILIALWFLFRRSLMQTVMRLLPVALVSLAVLSLWIVRNYGVFGAFVPMTTTSGANFWQGSSQYTIAYFRAGYDVQWTSPPDMQTEDLNSREADAERFALALQFLRDNPDKIPELLWLKFLVHWSIDIAPRLNPGEGQLPRVDYKGDVIPDTTGDGQLELGGLPPGDPVGEYSSGAFALGRVIHRYYWGGLFFSGLAGMVLTARRWRWVSLLWLTQFSMTFVYIAFHPSTRYRAPTDPLLFLFSAAALLWLWTWIRPRLGRRGAQTL